MHEMCRVLVEVGGYMLAWIALAENDERKTVRPAAICGEQRNVVKGFDITWADNASGGGPTGRAIRTGQPHINRNFATDPAMARWRNRSLKSGFGSSAALPLKDGGTTFGAIVLVSAKADAFDSEEMALLVEMQPTSLTGSSRIRCLPSEIGSAAAWSVR